MAHIAAVRRVLLQRFRRTVRLMLSPQLPASASTTADDAATAGAKLKGKAFQLDRDEQRVARRVACLRRILGVKPKRATPRQPVGKSFARQRSPPRPDHR